MLRAGCQILVAPQFPPVADWSARLTLSAGVTIAGDHAVPREPWREPTSDELALLVRDPALPLTQADLDAGLALVTLPHHLLTEWWQSLEAALASGRAPNLATFLDRACAFLAFKNLLPAAGLTADLLACAPGRPSLRTDPTTNEPAGLGWSGTLWGLFNVGTGPGRVAFLNAPVDLDAAPDYPIVGLRLEPGEGVRLPRAGLLLDGATLDAETPGLWLLARCQEDGP